MLDPTIPGIDSIAYSPANSQQVFFGNSLGIWRSLGAGVTWGLVSGGPEALDLLPDRSNPNILYAGVRVQGMLQSTNGGDGFQGYGAGLGNLVVRALAPTAPHPRPSGRAQTTESRLSPSRPAGTFRPSP